MSIVFLVLKDTGTCIRHRSHVKAFVSKQEADDFAQEQNDALPDNEKVQCDDYGPYEGTYYVVEELELEGAGAGHTYTAPLLPLSYINIEPTPLTPEELAEYERECREELLDE